MFHDTYIISRWRTFDHAVSHLHISSFLVWLYISRPPPRCIMVGFLVFGRMQILKQIDAIVWCHFNMIYQGKTCSMLNFMNYLRYLNLLLPHCHAILLRGIHSMNNFALLPWSCSEGPHLIFWLKRTTLSKMKKTISTHHQ